MLRSNIQQQKKTRDDKEREHKEKTEACIKCFNEAFAPGVLLTYLEDITALKLRKAWARMCEDMDGVIGGASSAAQLQYELLQFKYNNEFVMDI
jgi:hypothetical protein